MCVYVCVGRTYVVILLLACLLHFSICESGQVKRKLTNTQVYIHILVELY